MDTTIRAAENVEIGKELPGKSYYFHGKLISCKSSKIK